MFYYLSKFVGFFLSPTLWLCFFVLLVAWAAHQHKKNLLLVLIFTALLALSPLTVFIAYHYEQKAPNLKEFPTTPATVVVLAGGTIYPNKSRISGHLEFKYLGQSGRFLEAMRLVRANPQWQLALSRGHPAYEDEGKTAQLFTCDLFPVQTDDWCQSRIHLIGHSRNTHEEVLNLKQLLAEKNLPETLILVTSAGHMVRAHRAFLKEFKNVHPFPVDYKILPENIAGSWGLSSLNCLSSLLHEWIGFLGYALTGRL